MSGRWLLKRPESTEAEFLLADAHGQLGPWDGAVCPETHSLESVGLAEGVLDTWNRVLPEGRKDPHRVALETECRFRITALSLPQASVLHL